MPQARTKALGYPSARSTPTENLNTVQYPGNHITDPVIQYFSSTPTVDKSHAMHLTKPSPQNENVCFKP